MTLTKVLNFTVFRFFKRMQLITHLFAKTIKLFLYFRHNNGNNRRNGNVDGYYQNSNYQNNSRNQQYNRNAPRNQQNYQPNDENYNNAASNSNSNINANSNYGNRRNYRNYDNNKFTNGSQNQAPNNNGRQKLKENYKPNNNRYNRSKDKESKMLSKCSQREKQIREIESCKLECSVCCEGIKPAQSVWSCLNCYHILHLSCTQKWANSCKSEEGWRCPLCQNFIKQIPRDYFCFCGKVKNPEFNRSDLAHSCGDVCGRMEQCQHPCTQLCHPGW